MGSSTYSGDCERCVKRQALLFLTGELRKPGDSMSRWDREQNEGEIKNAEECIQIGETLDPEDKVTHFAVLPASDWRLSLYER